MFNGDQLLTRFKRWTDAFMKAVALDRTFCNIQENFEYEEFPAKVHRREPYLNKQRNRYLHSYPLSEKLNTICFLNTSPFLFTSVDNGPYICWQLQADNALVDLKLSCYI